MAAQLQNLGTVNKEERCAIYARFSSDLQKDTSVEDQIRQCRDYASRQAGWVIAEEYVRFDRAISGASLAGRDALQSLIAAAKQHSRPFERLLVDDTSRLARNLEDSLRIVKILEFHGVYVTSVSQRVNSEDKASRSLFAFYGMMDEQFLSGLADKVHRGQEGRVLKQRIPGGRCYGYRNVYEYDETRKGRYGNHLVIGVKYEIVSEEAAIIVRIFEMYAAGMSLTGIAKTLNREGILSPQPPRKTFLRGWCPTGIREMLRNKKYIGIHEWNRTCKVRNPETQKKVMRRRPESEWQRVEVPEWRIVSDALWGKVHAQIEQMKRFGTPRLGGLNRTRQSRTYVFSGSLECGSCGRPITIITGGGNRVRYGCRNHKSKELCANNLTIRRDRLEEQLLDWFTGNISPEVLAEIAKQCHEAIESRLLELRAEAHKRTLGAQGQKRERDQLVIQRENILDAISQGAHRQSSGLLARLTEIETRIEAIDKSLDAPADFQDIPISIVEVRHVLSQRLNDLKTALSSSPLTAKQWLRRYVRRIVLTPVQTVAGQMFETKVEFNMSDIDSGVLLNNSSSGIVQQYTFPLTMMGPTLNPNLSIRSQNINNSSDLSAPFLPVGSDNSELPTLPIQPQPGQEGRATA